MAEMSDYLEVKLLNLTLNGSAFTAVNNPYVSLHTADPTDAGTGTEVSGGSYARTAASFATASGTSGLVATDADVTFPTATGTWGVVGWIGLWDASTGGNMLYHTALDATKTIDSGDIFKITTGNLTVELA
jgi:hypothetical protein|tara:strand:+ start:851 stop:1243 length:393 start_codon:yes stop_codon:yes gene_type:complete